MALYSLTLDPATLSATVALEETSQGAAAGDVFQLATNRFFSLSDFEVSSVSMTDTTIDIEYLIRHPFPAPADPAGAPSPRMNRADLGFAGATAFLFDAPSGSPTYFGSVITNTDIMANPDGYLRPEGLLDLDGLRANTFPFNVIVDESGTGNRIGLSNGGVPTGNFGADGWTRAELGTQAPFNGWTGYGVLHQGQAARNTLQLNRAALSGAPVTFQAALIARYVDPRGGSDAESRLNNRLPAATQDAFRFAYRMPHGALDGAPISVAGPVGALLPDIASSVYMGVHVVDWDARAVETTHGSLADDPNPLHVAQGESGTPAVSLQIPELNIVRSLPGSSVLDEDSLLGGDPAEDSGLPGDPLGYQLTINLPPGHGFASGTYRGLLAVHDVEAEHPVAIPLDRESLQPLSVGLPSAVTFQHFDITIAQPRGQEGGWAWVQDSGEATSGYALAVGPDNSVYVAWHQSVPEGSGSSTSSGRTTVSRLTSSGVELWNWTQSGSSAQPEHDLAVDAQGAVYLASSSTPESDSYNVRPVLTKLSPQGTKLWQRVGLGRGTGLSVLYDNYALYFGGSSLGDLDLGLGVRTTPNPYQTGFIYRMDPLTGDPNWGYTDFTEWSSIEAMAADHEHNVLGTGYLERISDLTPGAPLVFGDGDFAAYRLSPAGEYLWDAGVGNETMQHGLTICEPRPGLVVVGGISIAPSTGDRDQVLVAFNDDGTVAWNELDGTEDPRRVLDLVATPEGHMHGIIRMYGMPGSLSEFDADGQFLRTLDYGLGQAAPQFQEVALAPNGDLVIAGSFVGSIDIHPDPLQEVIIATDNPQGALLVTRLRPDYTW